MMKKLLYLLILAACIVMAPGLAARQVSGQWTVLPTTGDVSYITETGDRTYFLCGPSLFSLADDGELYAYSTANKLTDNGINGIWYNADGRYLAIAYTNGNIDLLHDDGSVVNMAEIKDAVITGSRRINDMAFGKGRIYVATDFGLVVYDESKHLVIESGIYNQPVNNVMSLGEKILIVTDHAALVAPYDIRHNQLDKFTRVGSVWASHFAPVNDTSYVYIHVEGPVYLITVDAEHNDTSVRKLDTGDLPGTSVGRSSDGAFFTYGNKICFISGKDGTIRTATLPEGYGLPAFAATGLESVWATADDGLANFNLSGDKPTVLSKGFMPEGVTTDMPAYMQWTADGSRLYIGNVGTSFTLAGSISDGYEVIARTCYLENGNIRDIQPREVSNDNVAFNRYQNNYATKKIIGAPSRFCVDPDDNDIVYIPTRLAGLFVIKDGKVLNVINHDNSPTIGAIWGKDTEEPYTVAEIMYAGIDGDGNLWITELLHADNKGTPTMKVLPASKRRTKIDKVTKDDWLTFELPASFAKGYRDFQVLFCKKSNMNFLYYGDATPGMVAMNHNGTPSNFRDDKLSHLQELRDSNGNTINYGNILCAAEDADGKVWVGTKLGILVMDNPSDALNPSFTFRRPIVPRNDGTNLGDYLLSTEKINCITVDPTNRKWVATENSGLYLVSADGTEILQNFTPANSPLPDNCVYSVACDISGNKVYIGAAGGTFVYDSDSSPAAESFSDVYAYPNPVRPDYTGWITVTGLMDNSLVKIADAAGNVFFQGKSEGGMVTWDGCDSTGQRVRSGIYFVFASQNGQGSSGVVTKIMVIN